MRGIKTNLLLIFGTPFALGSLKTSRTSLQADVGLLEAPKKLNCEKRLDVGAFDYLYEGISVGRMDIPEIQDGSGARFVTVDGGIVYHIYPANEDRRERVASIRAEFDRAYECLVGAGASPEFKKWFVDLTRRFVDSNDANNMEAYILVAKFLQARLRDMNLNNSGLSTENLERSITEKDTGRFFTTGFDDTAQRMVLPASIHIPAIYRELLQQISWRIDDTEDCDKIWELVNLRGFVIATQLQFNEFDKLSHDSERLWADLFREIELKESEIQGGIDSVKEILVQLHRANERLLMIQDLSKFIFENLYEGLFPVIQTPFKCSARFYIFNHPDNPINDRNKCGHDLLESSIYVKHTEWSSEKYGMSFFLKKLKQSQCLRPTDMDPSHAYAKNIREVLRCRLHVTKVDWEQVNLKISVFRTNGQFTPEGMIELGDAAEALWLIAGMASKDISQAFEVIQR